MVAFQIIFVLLLIVSILTAYHFMFIRNKAPINRGVYEPEKSAKRDLKPIIPELRNTEFVKDK